MARYISLFVAMSIASLAFGQSKEIKSTGACSPNIVSNSDPVTLTITCTDPAIAGQLKEVLKRVLEGNRGQNDIRERLDLVLEILSRNLDETREVLNALAEQHSRRRLTTEQREQIVQVLRDSPTEGVKLHVVYLSGDPEVSRYAEDFREVFESAGVEVTANAMIASRPDEISGLSILVNEVYERQSSEVPDVVTVAFRLMSVLAGLKLVEANGPDGEAKAFHVVSTPHVPEGVVQFRVAGK